MASRHLKLLLCILIQGLSPSISFAQTTILTAVGDSITQGKPPYSSGIKANGCRCNGYIPKLEVLLDASGWPSSVYNYGINGDRVENAASRTISIINSKNPDYVLFLVGTNDLLGEGPSFVKAGIEVAINNILNKGKIPIIGTLLPDTRPFRDDAKNIKGTNTLIRELLLQMNVQLADFYDNDGNDPFLNSYDNWKDNGNMYDGLHPNSTGYQLMADIWFDALKQTKPIGIIITPILQLLLLDD